MSKKFTRRLLFKGTLVATASLIGGFYFYRIFRWRNPEQLIIDLTYNNLEKLTVSKEEIEKFAHDFVNYYGEKYSKIISASRFHLIPFGDEERKVQEFGQFISDIFIKSSTLWLSPSSLKSNDSINIKYTRLYNPFNNPCENVLANFG